MHCPLKFLTWAKLFAAGSLWTDSRCSVEDAPYRWVAVGVGVGFVPQNEWLHETRVIPGSMSAHCKENGIPKPVVIEIPLRE